MKVIAIEEAFSLAGAIPPIQLSGGGISPHWLADWGAKLADVGALRVADMDANGVDMQVLSYTSPGLETIADPATAVTAARTINDALQAIVGARPDRFAGFGVLPLQDPKAAVEELRRAVEELGLRGVLVNDHVNGHYLDEPQFEPVWAELERVGVTLYLHPAIVPADDWSVFTGYPALGGPTWGWTAQVGAHALRIVYSGVFERFPGATLTLGHMGELLPFQLARLDSRYEQADPATKLPLLPSAYIRRNVYVTTSGVFSHAALLGATLEMGIDHVLFAIDYPYERSEVAMEFLRTAPFSEADKTRIASSNAERLLGL